jgi:ABC-2 type transport system ATP-binding protein
MNPILECQSLSKKFSGSVALSDVNLTLERGRIIGLLGPNGSGKTTLLKVINGLLVPDSGSVKIAGMEPGVQTKKIVSYLPERTYLADWMKVSDIIEFFKDFYEDFDPARAKDMLERLHIDPSKRLKTLSKGTKEKVQLILVMSRKADLYCLDEPIGGVDPASRDYILNTIISNYDENATVLISTHLIAEIENILDEAIFIKDGSIMLHSSVDDIRTKEGKSIDSLFREVFRC